MVSLKSSNTANAENKSAGKSMLNIYFFVSPLFLQMESTTVAFY